MSLNVLSLQTSLETCYLFNVGLYTEYVPHRNSIKDGKGDNKFIITVAPQKLICPKGKT